MRDLAASEIRRLHKKVAAADRRIALTMLPGKVAQKDPERRLIRLEIGRTADGAPILGPWSRWQEATAGTSRIHAEPAMNEQMVLWSQSGTVGAASMAVPGTYDQDHASPSQSSDQAVWECGAARLEMGPAGFRLVGPVAIEGSALTHNGKNVGDDHVHIGVEPGGGTSGPPA